MAQQMCGSKCVEPSRKDGKFFYETCKVVNNILYVANENANNVNTGELGKSQAERQMHSREKERGA